jgi:hypothetical protein
VLVLPRVAHRGGGLLIWRVAKDTYNKQLRTADMEWSSGWEDWQ